MNVFIYANEAHDRCINYSFAVWIFVHCWSGSTLNRYAFTVKCSLSSMPIVLVFHVHFFHIPAFVSFEWFFFLLENKQTFYLYFFAYKFIGCARDRRTIMSWIITWWNLRCCKLTQIDVKIVAFYIWSFQQHILNFYFHHFQYFFPIEFGSFFCYWKKYTLDIFPSSIYIRFESVYVKYLRQLDQITYTVAYIAI